MLPAPAISSLARGRRSRITSPQKRISEILLGRARTTNLAVLLLASICIISLLLNIRNYVTSSSELPRSYEIVGTSILSTLNRHSSLKHVHHLVIVPCHSIWKGIDTDSRLNESHWILEPYQVGGNRVAAFFEHIARGAELVRNDENSLLVFSGGQTRLSSTTTEAESYLRLALGADLFRTLGSDSDTQFMRVTTENYALDSYQNLLFSVARFREYTGRFPKKITVVGYEFKKKRFVQLHRKAVRWPEHQFKYVGIDPDGELDQQAQQSELKNGYVPYTLDRYGCHSSLLVKRRQRNPFSRFHSYYVSSPELTALFDWCPNETREAALFTGTLPWDPI